MRAITNPKDDLRLANERGAELRRVAAEHRLAAELQANRPKGLPVAANVPGQTTRRRLLAVGAAVLLAVGIGSLANQAEAATATDRVVAPCDHPDGYRPTCSMLTGRPDGWYVPTGPTPSETTETVIADLDVRVRQLGAGPNMLLIR